MRQNTSGLEPSGRAVLVKMYEPEKKKGLIEIPELVKERSSVMEQRAEVIAIGAQAWEDEGPLWKRFFGLRTKRAEAGDKVIVTKFAGYVTRGTADNELYRLVNDRDIFCKITDEKDLSNG